MYTTSIMKAGIVTSLAALRQALPPGMVARRYGSAVQIYALDPGPYPATPDQVSLNRALDRAAQAWRSADPALRLAWNDFASRNARRLQGARRRGPVPASGYTLYSQASVRRQMLGHGPELGAPCLLPPEPPTGLFLDPMPAADPREFRFQITHRLTPGPDHVVVVRLTPPTRGPGRKPRREDARLTAGWSPASARELPPSGAPLVFSGAPFAVPPGRRFGAYARVVRVSDGFASPELAGDFVRT